jgi:soluble lytic murein transglycosylase-like protein
MDRLFSIFIIIVVCLLAWPNQLVGDSDQAAAAKRQRMEKIHTWLQYQDARIGTAAVLAHRILQDSEKNHLDPVLILAIIQVESGFDHEAVSPRGALGLMQVRPQVVSELAQEGKMPARVANHLQDPLVNVQVGISYLAYLHQMFGDIEVALTAYNWGPTTIRQKLAAKEAMPMQYAMKVLRAHRSLAQELARV